jgi:hypothetical protein
MKKTGHHDDVSACAHIDRKLGEFSNLLTEKKKKNF